MRNGAGIITERSDKGLCPICEKPLDANFKVEEYNGRKIWICKAHPVMEIKR